MSAKKKHPLDGKRPHPGRNPSGTISPRERKFIAYYLENPNGKEAAIKAGFSPKTANAQACQILKRPNVKALVEAAFKKLEEKTGITAEWVLRELHRKYKELELMNRASTAEIYRDDGSMKEVHEWPEHWQQKNMVKGLKVREVFEFDPKTHERKLSGYIKEATFTDHIQHELNLLKTIGEHVNVKAFDPKVIGGIQEGGIRMQIVYVDQRKQITGKDDERADDGKTIDLQPAG